MSELLRHRMLMQQDGGGGGYDPEDYESTIQGSAFFYFNLKPLSSGGWAAMLCTIPPGSRSVAVYGEGSSGIAYSGIRGSNDEVLYLFKTSDRTDQYLQFETNLQEGAEFVCVSYRDGVYGAHVVYSDKEV